MNRVKNIVEKIKTEITPKKTVAVVLAAAVALAGLKLTGGKKQAGGNIIPRGTRTVVLASGNLNESVTVTGTVKSCETVNVTGTVENTTVSEILVQVGDDVEEGDVIIKLDTGKILESIEKAKQKLAETARQAQEKFDNAREALENAEDTEDDADKACDSAKAVLADAKTAFGLAKEAVAPQQAAYDEAVAAEQQANTEMNKAVAAANSAYTAAENAYTEWQDAQADYETALKRRDEAAARGEDTAEYESALAEAENKKAEKENQYNAQKESYESLKATADSLVSDFKMKQETVKAARAELDTAKNTTNYYVLETEYNSALSAKDKAKANLTVAQAACEKAEDDYETARKNLENARTSDELEELYEKYNDCILTAPARGKVTGINASVGGNANGTLAVIEDTRHLKISTSFRESDVQKIETGMECIITSDANDRQLSGYVSQISPTASGGMNSSGDVSFSAEITINGTDHGLLVGMNARAEVIISQVSNVFSVPYDAVGTDENGNSVVYVQNGEDFVPVVVTTGMETDYFIEISSSQLKRGMVIRASADETESGTVVFDEDGEEKEAAFGMGGMMPGIGGMQNGSRPSGGRPQGSNMPGGRG